MKSIEKVGSTVDVAVTEALIELGASTDQVTIEVISKGSRGILGIGAKKAKVRVTVKEQQASIQLEESPIKEEISKQAVASTKPVQLDEAKEENKVPVKNDKPEVKARRFEDNKDSEDMVVVTEEEMDVIVKRSKDFLTKLLKEMNVECTINAQVVNKNRLSICLEGEKMGTIIGKRGETLDAIQYLINIVANQGRREYIKVMLDTENYRARREETLQKLALKLSKKAQKIRKPVSLEPMNPYDRRIIHSALQDSKIVRTHSEGKEPYRKVVITPIYQNKSYK